LPLTSGSTVDGILLAALQQRRWCGHRHHDQYSRPEPELAQEDTNVDGAYTSSNTRGLTVMRARLRTLRAALQRL
jgi:hypothetical protein